LPGLRSVADLASITPVRKCRGKGVGVTGYGRPEAEREVARVDGSVIAALITSGAALVVAVGGSLRNDVRTAADRRYERRRGALVDAQDAALELRNALVEYGTSLRARTTAAPAGAGAFVMSVPDELDTDVLDAEGRFLVTRSRVDDETVVDALTRWRSLARVNLIDPRDGEASAEQHAFAEINELIGAALRSSSGRLAD
jgi:hypothetical protein